RPEGMAVTLLPARGWSNHGRDANFARRAGSETKDCDAAVGFNRMPGLDVYYAADPCYAAAMARRPAWYRATPRCRARLVFERAVFGPSAATRCLLLSPHQQRDIAAHYRTPAERLLLLPPGIGRDRRRPPDAAKQ